MSRKPKVRSRPAPASPAIGERAAPSLFIRVKFGDLGFIGPGKAQLLELIERHGSISAAGRAMGMSYRRAWMIIEELNTVFIAPLVAKQTGGSGGGGAVLTDLGREVTEGYRRIESAAARCAAEELTMLAGRLAHPKLAKESGETTTGSGHNATGRESDDREI
jgi:molybdate transport system regulatory protein